MIQKTFFFSFIIALTFMAGNTRAANDGMQLQATSVKDVMDTSTDFLSDDQWRKLPREQRHARSRRQLLSRFEPSGTTSPERLSSYIDKYRQANVYDRRLYLYNVTAQLEPGTTASVILSGEVSVAQYKTGTERILGDLGFMVSRNAVQVLPTEKLGEDIYGVATTNVATLRKEPRMGSEQVNSVPMGGWVRLLREAREADITVPPMISDPAAYKLQGNWMLAQTLEGYIGFLRAEQFQRETKIKLPDALVLSPTTVTLTGSQVVLPVGSYVYSADSGYRLFHDAAPLPKEIKVVSVNHPAFTADDILRMMTPLTDVTRYVWGGVTHEGIDCSGFTQLLLRTQGIYIPRDAEEQAATGLIVAFGEDGVRDALPGDLLFFTNEMGRVGHVGISLGNGKLIHSAGRGVSVQTLREHEGDDDRSMADRLLFARRMMSR